MPLGTGHVIEDYVSNKVIQDWVFAINRDEKPAQIEVKQLARIDLTEKLQDKPLPELAADEYPKREYLTNQATLTVAVRAGNGTIQNARVLLLPQSVSVDTVLRAVTTGHDNIREILKSRDDASPPWAGTEGQPGIPDTGTLRAILRLANSEVINKPRTDNTQWMVVMPAIIAGAVTPNGAANPNKLGEQFSMTENGLLKSTNQIRVAGMTGPDGNAKLENIAPGSYTIVAAAKTSDAFYLWVSDVTLGKKEVKTQPLNTNSTQFSIDMKKAKAP
jgi:hypothetical protein